MTSDEIREGYLGFFEQRGHLRIPSASLVPSAHDPSALLTVAGMHPLKPYFLGQEVPPAPRLTSCQKSFRTVDIDNVGDTARHLTFFEMLGNFAFGDYFKGEAIEFAWELSREVFKLREQDIWVTVFEGDEELGLGPDEEAIEIWRSVGVPRERIVGCPRSENFWQAGPTGPCGPSSELYLDRGLAYGAPDDLPGQENERFLEYWNLVFTEYDQVLQEDGPGRGSRSKLKPLPARNIDTGLGLNRMAAILQGKESVFETDQFWPLIELGQELSGVDYGAGGPTDRALRILADHGRAMTFLVADGVVPSNEDRGYVLRRVMRRAIQQGRSLQMDPGFLGRYAERVTEIMGGTYPELADAREAIQRWLASEEEGFGRTIAQGTAMLEGVIDEALQRGEEAISGEVAFTLHDTFGFPLELTRELAGSRGLAIGEQQFDSLMERQRARGRAAGGGGGSGAGGDGLRERARALTDRSTAGTRFTGYETELQRTTVTAIESLGEEDGDGDRGDDGVSGGGGNRGLGLGLDGSGDNRVSGERVIVKLAESPFYAPGGGQVADTGTIESTDGTVEGVVTGVVRVGDDQALEVIVRRGRIRPEEVVLARVDPRGRHAVEANHTATHLLQAALRRRLGAHVRQAGSYVGPDKLRFDFSHGGALTTEELVEIEDQVNAWISLNDSVHAIQTTLAQARSMGAMALFGEKYGEVVRMVEVADGGYSRELCGGTHVRRTGEIGPFRIISETSSAANVRRIEAVTGPEAVRLLREHDRDLREISQALRTSPEGAAEAVRAREDERRELEKQVRQAASAGGAEIDVDELIAGVEEIDGVSVLTAAVPAGDMQALLATMDRVKARLGDGAILLGCGVQEPSPRVHLVAAVTGEGLARGVKAGPVVAVAAKVVGGGGGGRDAIAQAGGREPQKLGKAIAAGRGQIVSMLAR